MTQAPNHPGVLLAPPTSSPVPAHPDREPRSIEPSKRRQRRGGLGPFGTVGLVLLVALAACALFATAIAPYDPRDSTGRPFEPPSGAHLLGTNDIGQDILSELIWGSRVSLAIGALAAVGSTLLGTLVGVAGGYYRGRLDALLMRTVDVILVIPLVPLAIVLAVYLGPSVGTLAVLIASLLWAEPARVVRSVVLSQGARDYVLAARSLGAGNFRIVWHCILPATFSVVLAQFVHLASRSILLEATLAFLGLGDPVQKSWGSVLFYAQARGAFLSEAWVWWVLPPGVLITVAVLGFALVGFDMERIVNPRLQKS